MFTFSASGLVIFFTKLIVTHCAENSSDELFKKSASTIGSAASEIVKGFKKKDKSETPQELFKNTLEETMIECAKSFFVRENEDLVISVLNEVSLADFTTATVEDVVHSIRVAFDFNGLTSGNSGIDDNKIRDFIDKVTISMNGKVDKDQRLILYVNEKLSKDNYVTTREINDTTRKINDTTQEINAGVKAVNKKTEEIQTAVDDIKTDVKEMKASMIKSNNKNDEENKKNKATTESPKSPYEKLTANIRKHKEEYAKKWTEPLFLNDTLTEAEEAEELKKTVGKTLEDTYIEHSYTSIKLKEEKKNNKEYYTDECDKKGENGLESIIINDINNKKCSSRWLISGVPGIGKSSLVIKLAHTFIDNKNIMVIDFSKLNDEFDELKEECKKIEYAIAKCFDITKNEFKEFINNQLDYPVLILDGFDEFISGKNDEITLLKEFLELQETGLQKLHIIITSRDNYVKDIERIDRLFERWDKLKYFSIDDIRLYHQRLKGNILYGDISNNLEVIGVPVILYLCLISGDIDIKKENESRFALYQKIFDKDGGLYRRFKGCMIKYKENVITHINKGTSDKAYGVGERPHIKDLQYIDAIDILFKELAFRIFINDEKSINGETYRRIINQVKIDDKYVLQGEKDIVNNYPIKVMMEGNERVEFVHKSIFEYYAALKIYNCIEELYTEEIKDTATSDSDMTKEKFVKNFRKDMGRLLSKGVLMRVGEHELYDFLKELLKNKYNKEKKKNSIFARNLQDMELLEGAVFAMFENGLSYYVPDTDAIDKETENTESYPALYDMENKCFKNIIDLVQLIREVTGNRSYLFGASLCSDSGNKTKHIERYIKSDHYNGLNLSGFTLSNLDLSGADLSWYNLSQTHIKNSLFNRANMLFANLTGAQINDNDFSDAILSGAGCNVSEIKENNITNDRTVFEFRLGKYKQGKKGEVEQIIWRVLEQVGDYVLLLSEKIIDCLPYNTKFVSTDWEHCSLNKWLQDNIYNGDGVFENSEKKMIISPQNIPYKNISKNADGCNEIFLLSYEELLKYFDSRSDEKKEKDRNEKVVYQSLGGAQAVAYGTEYAKKHNLLVSDYNGASHWWLRSGGSAPAIAMHVDNVGDVYTIGDDVNLGDVGVRPALWINLKS
ncbi:MAG: NACHT domain-containing protein [Lachnospiraceae bacterium]|nr:NACHT domain-containing protein [Lachnospiraceae bacterium]